MSAEVKLETNIVATITTDCPRQYDIPKHHAKLVKEMCNQGLKVPAVHFIRAEYNLGLMEAKNLTEALADINHAFYWY
jgi:ribosomal protein L7/L12